MVWYGMVWHGMPASLLLPILACNALRTPEHPGRWVGGWVGVCTRNERTKPTNEQAFLPCACLQTLCLCLCLCLLPVACALCPVPAQPTLCLTAQPCWLTSPHPSHPTLPAACLPCRRTRTQQTCAQTENHP